MSDQIKPTSLSRGSALERLSVGVVVERRNLANPWLDHIWLPTVILPGVPAAVPGTQLFKDSSVTRIYAGPYVLSLYSIETANYLNNLATGAPKIWVALHGIDGIAQFQVVGVTADPAEGESYTEAAGNIVEALPMPPEIAERVASFVAKYHVERPFFKRQRNN